MKGAANGARPAGRRTQGREICDTSAEQRRRLWSDPNRGPTCALPLLFFGLLLLAPGCFGSSERSEYVGRNKALYESLPKPPGVEEQDERSAPYRAEEKGPVAGYTTTFILRAPPTLSSREVVAFYAQELPRGGWALRERFDGPVLNFSKGRASLSLNLESYPPLIEMTVDHLTKASR